MVFFFLCSVNILVLVGIVVLMFSLRWISGVWWREWTTAVSRPPSDIWPLSGRGRRDPSEPREWRVQICPEGSGEREGGSAMGHRHWQGIFGWLHHDSLCSPLLSAKPPCLPMLQSQMRSVDSALNSALFVSVLVPINILKALSFYILRRA